MVVAGFDSEGFKAIRSSDGLSSIQEIEKGTRKQSFKQIISSSDGKRLYALEGYGKCTHRETLVRLG